MEDFDTKVGVLGPAAAAIGPEAIIATNTSSLSISRLGEAIGQARRTVGMHFFNPAPLMELVEVIASERTEPQIVDRAAEIAEGWGKKAARAADVPGFIVNHVARPYYLEAFRILEDGIAGAAVIDGTMRDLGGFRMGPLELTDLIGQDVNAATTRSVWQQLGEPPLLEPSRLQEQLVTDGRLGRKSGRGVYVYKEDGATPAVEVERVPFEPGDALRRAVSAFASRASGDRGGELQRYVFARILVAIIAQAAAAHERGVASKADIDTALRYGTNYPKGPFEWAREIGSAACGGLLEALNESAGDGRFAVPAVLKAGV